MEYPKLPPCLNCAHRVERNNATLCLLDPKFSEPLFLAVKWHGPEFLCFREKADANKSFVHP